MTEGSLTREKGLKSFLPLLLLLFAAGAVFGNSLANGFLMDDESLIVNNPGLKLAQDLRFLFAPFLESYFRPMAFLSFAADHLVWGLNPFGYHLMSILLHLLNGILLFFLIRSLWNNRELAFLASLFFLIHPIQNISVNYIAERGNLLAAFFSLSALLMLAGRRTPAAPWRFAAAGLLFTGALLSRESAVLLPLYLMVILYIPSPKPLKRLERLGATIVFSLLGLAYFLWRHQYAGLSPLIFNPPAAAGPIGLTAFLLTVLNYLRLLLVPAGIVMIRGLTVMLNDSQLLLLSLPSLAVLLALICQKKDDPQKVLATALLWLLIGFVSLCTFSSSRPSMGFIMQDNQLYFCSIGFFILLAQSILWFKKRFSPKAAPVVLFCFVFFYTHQSVVLNRLYRSSEVYCRYWLKLMPSCHIPLFHLAKNLEEKKDCAAAVAFYERSLVGTALDAEVYTNIGNIFWKKGKPEEALKNYLLALEVNPNRWEASNNIGVIFLQEKKFEEARQWFLKTTSLAPDQPGPYLNLIRAYEKENRTEKAIALTEQLWDRRPREETWGILLVELYLKGDDQEKGFSLMERLLTSSRDMNATLERLANAAFNAKNWPAAETLWEELLRRIPLKADACLKLGILKARQGGVPEALELWKKGQEIDPSDTRFADLIAEAQKSHRGPV